MLNKIIKVKKKKETEEKNVLKDITFDEKSFISLLTDLIGLSKKLQNSPPRLVPQEGLAADVVVAFLEPYTHPKGPLKVRKITYKEGRSNVIVEYPASNNSKKNISFVGSHLDVVAANAEKWAKDPFKLTVEGDTLYGRGVTDCLGHVAMLSELFRQLAIHKPSLNIGVYAVFIANEESSSEQGIGVDELEKQGELAPLKSGPLFWVDSANFGPTLGTAGVLSWELTITGKLFHSGLPHKAINPIELGMEVIRYMQDRFYKDFPYGEKEKEYLFECGSSLKPTQISTPGDNSINQIPHTLTVSGDIRITPFYTPDAVKAKVESYLKELIFEEHLVTRGHSKYELKSENKKGGVTLKWLGTPYKGVAVDLKSKGYQAILNATNAVRGEAKPFSLTGSLPLIKDLQEAGFDVQICGFGRMDAYHADNEFAKLSEFSQGSKIVSHIINSLNSSL